MAESTNKTEVHDLSLLALLAAHELERLQRREPAEGRYLSDLRDRLTQQLSGPARLDIKNIAPSTVALYRQAVLAATNSDPADYESLVEAITSLVNKLGQASESAPEPRSIENLAQLLAFVTALHRQLLAQKQRSHAARRTSRYRV